MKIPKFRKKYLAGALAAGLVMGAGGVAAAYYTSTGSGTGSASVGHAVPLTITETRATGTLAPGTSVGETVVFKIADNSPTTESLTQATYRLARGTVSSTVPAGYVITKTSGTVVGPNVSTGNNVPTRFGCLTKWFTMAATPSPYLPPWGNTTSVPAHGSVTATFHITMATTATTDQDACEGVNPQLTFSITG